MSERMYRLDGTDLYRELNPETWFSWYTSSQREHLKHEFPGGVAVIMFTGLDDSGEEPPRLWEARMVRNLPNGLVEENSWRLPTFESAKARLEVELGPIVP